MPPRDLNFELGSGIGQRGAHHEDYYDRDYHPDGRKKDLTSRMLGMRRMWIEGSYDLSRDDAIGHDGTVDIVGERCRALADAAFRIADSLRAEPAKFQSSLQKLSKRKSLHLSTQMDRNLIVERFLGTVPTKDEDAASEAWSPGTFGTATECEPTPHMEMPTQPSPTDGGSIRRSLAQQTPVQSRFLAGGGGSAVLSPTFSGPGGYGLEYDPAAALGGSGRLPPADLDQQGQPLGPPSPEDILRELAVQVANIREEVEYDREAQRHEAHVRQVGLLTDASVKVPALKRSSSGGPPGVQRSMKGMLDPAWNHLGGADVSERLRTLTERVGQLYNEVHNGAGKVPLGCLELKADV